MDNNKNNRMCNGDCTRCSFQQRVYCASYMSRNNYAMMESVLAKLDEVLVKIQPMQTSDVDLIVPFRSEPEESSTMGQAV